MCAGVRNGGALLASVNNGFFPLLSPVASAVSILGASMGDKCTPRLFYVPICPVEPTQGWEDQERSPWLVSSTEWLIKVQAQAALRSYWKGSSLDG